MKLPSLIHNPAGPLTAELELQPGGFGLGRVPAARRPTATTTAVCGFCSTGCGLKLHLREGRALGLTPDPAYPVNLGMACPKGWEALAVLESPSRGTTPLLDGQAIAWPSALQEFCDRFKAIQDEHGAESVAFLSTGQMPIEEMAYLGVLAKSGMGMIHGDGNTRQCMATAVVAYKQSFGFDAPPYSYTDFSESDVLVFVGANPCIAHPIMWERVCHNPHDPTIIVIDPRRTETAMAATHHLPIQPKSDLALFYALARELIAQDLINRGYIEAHTNGFADFAAHVESFTLEHAAEVTGIGICELRRIATLIGQGKRVSFWWTMGVNQSYEGVRLAQSLINLALMTGNMGRPGTGANSITGQANAMGSRLFSNTTNLLGGHDFTNPEHREKVADILGIESDRIPAQNSLPYNKIIDGIKDGKIKGLWVVCTNPAHSWINRNEFKEIIAKLDFLVVQDMYHDTETARLAHLYLPAAGWGEKEGTVINSERRIGRFKKVRQAPGQALADFAIFKLIAQSWGCAAALPNWQTPADVFEGLKAVSRNQPCDISGIADYAMIDRCGGVQWPCPEGAGEPAQERRLFGDGRFFHSDERARFIFSAVTANPEPPDADYPFVLLTGRGSAAQWHTNTRTNKSAILRALAPTQPHVEINPQDAKRLGIESGASVCVASRRGEITVTATLKSTVQTGQLFIPMHVDAANLLTQSVFDPYSFQPSYKASAVSLAKLE
jgi:assimilatory nitrate reductase catalytic subunit